MPTILATIDVLTDAEAFTDTEADFTDAAQIVLPVYGVSTITKTCSTDVPLTAEWKPEDFGSPPSFKAKDFDKLVYAPSRVRSAWDTFNDTKELRDRAMTDYQGNQTDSSKCVFRESEVLYDKANRTR